MNEFDLIATSTFGLERVVARELEDLGYRDLQVLDGRVRFRGIAADIARCNIRLRSADRVLLLVGEFPAPDFGALFDQTVELPWPDLLPIDAAFPVNGRSVRSRLHAVPAVQGCVKKAIVESLRKRYQRFRFDETGSRYDIEVSILKDIASITMDTSGPGLHKRGYREIVGAAPLRETMAAALVQLSYWSPDRLLLDPFCGTGTILIEAAMIRRRIWPGAQRTFACENWEIIPRNTFRDERRAAREDRLPATDEPLLGFDHDPGAIRLAERNAREAGVPTDIRFAEREISELSSSREFGVIITNPPYGERLGDDAEVEAVYREFGRVTESLATWSIYVLTSHRRFERNFGRRASRRRKLYNGRLECQLYQYLGPPPPRSGGDDDSDGARASELRFAEHPADADESASRPETASPSETARDAAPASGSDAAPSTAPEAPVPSPYSRSEGESDDRHDSHGTDDSQRSGAYERRDGSSRYGRRTGGSSRSEGSSKYKGPRSRKQSGDRRESGNRRQSGRGRGNDRGPGPGSGPGSKYKGPRRDRRKPSDD